MVHWFFTAKRLKVKLVKNRIGCHNSDALVFHPVLRKNKSKIQTFCFVFLFDTHTDHVSTKKKLGTKNKFQTKKGGKTNSNQIQSVMTFRLPRKKTVHGIASQNREVLVKSNATGAHAMISMGGHLET